MNKTVYLLILFFISYNQLFAKVSTEFEAKQYLRKLGVTSSKIIDKAEMITVESGKITGTGGITVSLPIYDFIVHNNIIIQRGAATSYIDKNNVIINADAIFISAIVIKRDNRKFLLIGKNLRDIVNLLL